MGNKTPAKVAFLASIYRHLEGFHLPYIKLLHDKGCQVHAFELIGKNTDARRSYL